MSAKILSIIVPVFNIADHVDHLADEFSKLADLDVQMIAVDDGSTDNTVERLKDIASQFDDFTLIENEKNAGAGVARNTGFPLATGKYTLFFDGDDYLHVDEILKTIEKLEETGADASINRYDFIRDGQDVSTGMNVIDRVLWRDFFAKYQIGSFALEEAPRFLEFTNYPWNKIVRTDHYQGLALTPLFGETRVNNDILGHWNILLHARTLVLVDRTIVTHHVSGARDHLSNRFGVERLDLFVALGTVHDRLRKDRRMLQRYAPVYWTFAHRLMIWAEGRLDPNVIPEYRIRRRALVSEISFEELLGVKKAGSGNVYRWLMERIG